MQLTFISALYIYIILYSIFNNTIQTSLPQLLLNISKLEVISVCQQWINILIYTE